MTVVTIRVEIYPPLRRFVGHRVVEVADKVHNLDELLDYLSRRYHRGFKQEVLDGLQDYSYLVALNGRPVWDMAATLSDGDIVAISAHFAGE